MKRLRKITVCVILLIAVLAGSVTASAASFNSYTYDEDKKAVAAPDAVVWEKSVYAKDLGIDSLTSPSDIFVDDAENVWVVDASANRVLKLNANLELQKTYTTVTDTDGKAYTFSNPQGIYVHPTGVYLTDTGNHRILQFDDDGKVVRVIGQPISNIFPSTFEYKPTKILVDTAGRMFVISAGFNQGLIELDRNGDFVTCLGAAEVNVSLADYFWRLISSEAQIERSASFVPTEYNNVNIDEDDFIYVTSSSFTAQEYQGGTAEPVRKLNAKGNNVLKDAGMVKPYGDNTYMAVGSYRGVSTIVDVCPLEYGMYAILDANRCRVFVYNFDGEMLFEFGVPGLVRGAMQTPVAMDYANSAFYIADKGKESITKYTLSAYGVKLFHTAMYHYNDQYEEETALWEEIIKDNNNNVIAQAGLGKSYYRTGNFTTAMRYFKLAGDRSNYSRAFKMYRQQRLATIIPYLFAAILLLVGGSFLFGLYRKKHPKKQPDPQSFRGSLKYALYMIFHPLDGSWDLKKEKRGRVGTGLLILLLSSVAFGVNSVAVGYVFTSGSANSTNFFLQFLSVLVPILLYCVCNWCVTSLMGGEGKFGEIVMAAGYSTTPILLIYPFATVFSLLLAEDEKDFYFVLIALAVIWTVGLLIFSSMEIHNYSMSKTLLVTLITLIVMVVVVVLAVLAFALVDQFVLFVYDLITELSLR